MKICFLEGDMSRRGGTERMTALLANGLAKKHEVHIISLSMAGDAVFFQLDDSVRHTVLTKTAGKLGMLKKFFQILRFLKEKQIDTVINVDTGMGIYGILAAIGASHQGHHLGACQLLQQLELPDFPHLRRFAARHGDAMVVLTQRDKENFEAHIPSKVPVHVIPNPAKRTAFTYDAEAKIILSAGALLPIKGYDRVVEIGKTIFVKHPDWQWHICGEGPEREKLEQAIHEAGLENNIILCGTVRDMDERYASAAMYVLTSHMEGLPMVLLEAKSHGLPLISFDIMTGPSDIIRDGVNGYLIPPDDTAAMAEKILALTGNDALRQSFSAQSGLDMEKFDWETILEKWEEILKK